MLKKRKDYYLHIINYYLYIIYYASYAFHYYYLLLQGGSQPGNEVYAKYDKGS